MNKITNIKTEIGKNLSELCYLYLNIYKNKNFDNMKSLLSEERMETRRESHLSVI